MALFQSIVLVQLMSLRVQEFARNSGHKRTLQLVLLTTFSVCTIHKLLREMNDQVGQYISFLMWSGYCYFIVILSKQYRSRTMQELWTDLELIIRNIQVNMYGFNLQIMS